MEETKIKNTYIVKCSNCYLSILYTHDFVKAIERVEREVCPECGKLLMFEKARV